MKQKVIDSKLNDVGRNFNYRKKEITFDMFKSFMVDGISFTQTNDGFMGWGDHVSSCGTLWVHTASFDGGCFIDNVRHTTKANNPYNNYVNAIAYWDLLNDNGKAFFMEFYKPDFNLLKAKISSDIASAKAKIERLENEYKDVCNEIHALTLT